MSINPQPATTGSRRLSSLGPVNAKNALLGVVPRPKLGARISAKRFLAMSTSEQLRLLDPFAKEWEHLQERHCATNVKLEAHVLATLHAEGIVLPNGLPPAVVETLRKAEIASDYIHGQRT